MTAVSDALDEAFERLAVAGFELPNGFVNHGPMACEALDAMGRDADLDAWSRRFAAVGGGAVDPVVTAGFEPESSLGEYRLLPEWVGFFELSVARHGWEAVVRKWVPVLMPSLSVALFHAAIRTAHATRAVSIADSAPRRAELARALGYWGARFRAGRPAAPAPEADDVGAAVCQQAAGAARAYLESPNLLRLHGVTGAMAVSLLSEHLARPDALTALWQLAAEERALVGDTAGPSAPVVQGISDAELAASAAQSGDPHVVKLVEACRRGWQMIGEPVFAAAAELVVDAT